MKGKIRRLRSASGLVREEEGAKDCGGRLHEEGLVSEMPSLVRVEEGGKCRRYAQEPSSHIRQGTCFQRIPYP